MAEKEERIYYIEIRVSSETKECEKCKANGWNCAIDTCEHFKQQTENRISRQEAIERIAKAIWETGYNEVLNISFDELKTKSHGSKSTTFGNFYKLTMKKAEATLNALLEADKSHKGPKDS